MKTFYFVAGLPRSGSTLLCNILAQNPRFHATHTSGCLDVLFGIRNQWNSLIEHRAHPDDAALLRVLRAVLEAYYSDVDQPVVIDKSRGWLAHLELAEAIIGSKAKVLVPVRSLPDVLASMERLHRETSKMRQPPGEAENYFQFQTQEGRCEYWLAGQNVVGIAYNRIRDAIQRGFADRMYLVRFDGLTASPEKTLRNIYEFLGEQWYEHNFDKVDQVTTEDDSLHGYEGLHTIRPKVEFTASRARDVIGESLVRKYQQFDF